MPPFPLRDAANLFITVEGTRFTCRSLGAPGAVPQVMEVAAAIPLTV